jgi:hypothetical protein
MTSVGHQTPTSDSASDVVSVLYHALQAAETKTRYIADAEERRGRLDG